MGRRRWLAWVAVASGLLWCLGVYVAEAHTGDRLWLFGTKGQSTLAFGKEARGAITVMNPSRAEVQVKVAPGCGCETLTPSKFTLQPLSSQQVSYSIDLSDASQGPRSKGFELQCSCGESTWNEDVVLNLMVLPPQKDQAKTND